MFGPGAGGILGISIHAPAGGATARVKGGEPDDEYFNSRPCGRGDARNCEIVLLPVLFQFTPLREGRLKEGEIIGYSGVFQFTPLREGRHDALTDFDLIVNFNSRPCGRGDR